MKVLVTGATGFIGRQLVPVLVARGHQVTACARDIGKADALDWPAAVQRVAADVHGAEPDLGERFGRPDALVHLAWPGLPNYKSMFHLEDNLPADFRFLKAMIAAGTRQVLVTGTCFEYGLVSGALAEHLPTAPVSAYALAKDTLRKMLQSLQASESFTLQWARLFYMHGPGQNPNSLLSQLDRAIDSGAAHFDMSGGEQLRDYLPVQAVASRLASLLEHRECAGVVNICNGEPISVRRLVEQHISARGSAIQPRLGVYPYPDIEPMAFWGDGGKFAAQVGVQ